jgi:hypothetical protein
MQSACQQLTATGVVKTIKRCRNLRNNSDRSNSLHHPNSEVIFQNENRREIYRTLQQVPETCCIF